jgi:hypothetical protein
MDKTSPSRSVLFERPGPRFDMKHPRLTYALALAVSSIALTGCSAFRAQVGIGTGFGAVVHIPAIAKFGACGGSFAHAGHDYDRGWTAGTGSRQFDFDSMMNVLGAWHNEGQTEGMILGMSEGESMAIRDRFQCSYIPPLTGRPKGRKQPWSFEINVMLLLFDLRLGFNPAYLSSGDDGPRTGPSEGGAD